MEKSTNYNLNLPEGTDEYDVEDFNDNFEIIDEEMKAIDNESAKRNGSDFSLIETKTLDSDTTTAITLGLQGELDGINELIIVIDGELSGTGGKLIADVVGETCEWTPNSVILNNSISIKKLGEEHILVTINDNNAQSYLAEWEYLSYVSISAQNVTFESGTKITVFGR